MTNPAATDHPMNEAKRFARIRRELLGSSFSTLKELRHKAESCGFSFVPVDTVHATDRQVHAVLKPEGVGEIHVYADRSQHWHPFHIRQVGRPATA
jgi:hypothetical protein